MAVGDFPVDPSAKNLGGGAPPPGHPRRCQAYNRVRQQCGQWAEKGVNYCKFHGGRCPSLQKQRMPGYYSKNVGGTFAKKLAELADMSDEDRLSLSEEADVARMMAERSLKLFNIVCFDQADKTTEEQKHAAINGARDAIEFVTKIVSQLAKVKTIDGMFVHAGQLNFFALALAKILNEVFGEEERERVDLVLQKINEIQMPADPSFNPGITLSIE